MPGWRPKTIGVPLGTRIVLWRKKFFTLRVARKVVDVEKLSREVVDVLSLEVFKDRLSEQSGLLKCSLSVAAGMEVDDW